MLQSSEHQNDQTQEHFLPSSNPSHEHLTIIMVHALFIHLLTYTLIYLARILSLHLVPILTPLTIRLDCAPMVPVIKKNGKVRICVDLKKLNEAVKRERFILPTLEDILPQLSGSCIFSTLDASSGFWQIPLDASCRKLTTFITPVGRFCFRRLPFGITSAPEIFQREMSTLLKDNAGTVAVMDDILVFGRDKEEHDRNLKAVLKSIKISGLKLNKEKCHFLENRRFNSSDILLERMGSGQTLTK